MQRAHLGGPAPIFRIVHPTDLSAASGVAFVHTLKLGLAAVWVADAIVMTTPREG